MDDDSLRADLLPLSRSSCVPEECLVAPPQKALEKFLGISLDPQFYRNIVESHGSADKREPPESAQSLSARPADEAVVPAPPEESQRSIEPVEPPTAEEPLPVLEPAVPEKIPDPTPDKRTSLPPLSPGSPGVETCLRW